MSPATAAVVVVIGFVVGFVVGFYALWCLIEAELRRRRPPRRNGSWR